MGFGCNAAAVVGCRIIASPRERIIAILTNNFVPCNGRFPILIAIITMFFTGSILSPLKGLLSAAILTGFIIFGIGATLAVSKILSATFLKGIPSSFVLELPPYRKPQIGKIIVRSVLDRTIFVLGRAILAAAPAGIIIWIAANTFIGGISTLSFFARLLNPFATAIGLDGYILTAFILGFPANEIVIPLIIMSYISAGSPTDYTSLAELKKLLIENGWTHITAICTMIFTLMHWPCATACLTIKKETKNILQTLAAIIIPTVFGFAICFVTAFLLRR